MSRTKRRRHRHQRSWWMQDLGGLPRWIGIVVLPVLILAVGTFVAFGQPIMEAVAGVR